MGYADLIDLIHKKDTDAKKHWFDTFHNRLSAIARRYAKSEEQAGQMLHPALHNTYEKLQGIKDTQDVEKTVVRLFIAECIAFIKEIRSEYYVASTVNASLQAKEKSFDLFDNGKTINLEEISAETLLGALRELVPSQRLIFNLHVIDGYSLSDAAGMLESSEFTLKSSLEKARFTLQKNIEKTLKTEGQ